MGPTESLTRLWIAGVPADAMNRSEAVERVDAAAAGDRPFVVVVTNANKAWQAARNPRLRAILASADLVVPEWAMVWGARRMGRNGVHNVGGLRLMARLLEVAERRGRSVYLLGATQEVVDALARRLLRERPALRLAGWHHGFFGDDGWNDVVGEIEATRPDLLFVALGSPAQEYRIAELVERLPGLRVAMGVGGSFEVLAGFKKDTPQWTRSRGLEWLFRLTQDPKRLWKRYLVTNTWFVVRVLRERWTR